MKRIPQLRPLSEDHHHGLALAWRCRQAAAGRGGARVSEGWADVERRFAAELEPHFEIEEKFLVPPLGKLGQKELLARLERDHRALRDAVSKAGARDAAALRRFADALEAHIRFEERELFETAQRLLPGEALDAVETACRQRRARKQS